MDEMTGILDKLLQAVLSLFPLSPFRETIDNFAVLPFLGYLNWFVPVAEMVSIGLLWLAAIATYYAWSVVARWAKIIK